MTENEKNKKIPTAQLTTKFMLTVRMMVGAYLVYTAYSLLDGLATAAGGEKIIFIIVMIAFPVIGGALIIHSALSIYKGKYVDGSMDAGLDEDEEKDVVETEEISATEE